MFAYGRFVLVLYRVIDYYYQGLEACSGILYGGGVKVLYIIL